MAYAALSTIQTIATGQPFLAATLQQANDNGEFLIDPPACSIKESTPQSLTTGVLTVLTADEENYDNDSMHSTASNTSRITIQTAGRYLFIATVSFAANATGVRFTGFRVDGTTNYLGLGGIQGVAGNDTDIAVARTIDLNAAQYVECYGQQSSGGNLDCTLREFAALFMTR